MNDDTREKRWQDHLPRSLPRYALLVCLALVVVSLGVVLMPARPPVPAEPPFSEQARAAALAETVRLKEAGSQLGAAKQHSSKDGSAPSADGPSAGAGYPDIERTVTLLTTQAQALLAPGENPADATGAAATDSGRATPPATSTATPAPSVAGAPSAGQSSAGPSVAPLPSTAAGLVAALAKSGKQRLADAAMADGGMARLLAAVGTAQLLRASAVAAGTGTTAPAADVASPQPSGTCPSPSASSPSDPVESDAGQSGPEQSDAGQSPAASSLGGALAAVVRTEAQAIYGYQVALPRLDGVAAKSAADQLARHETLLSGAESLSRLHCSAVPPREAGYSLGQSFLSSPAAGLGSLEAAALPAYGDLVALSEGETRQWAIAALLGAGKRAVLWGADPGALPGLDGSVQPATLPTQPAG
ncbi:DUF4439 domain-containing protein [Arthrobacter sp. NPDC056886]|uniref:DUF4439 domain-containing protein n=1 Tax=Arthrobacter sp. NPDC056886 TaxID=3345960 RepID=UPI00366A7284